MAKGKKQVIHDVLLQDKKDRRMLPDVPDPDNIRSGSERRGHVTIDPDGQINYEETIKKKSEGKRYLVSLKGLLICKGNGKTKKIRCTVIDLSYTGALITLDEDNGAECLERIRNAKRIIIDFEIEPGSMPEGAEMRIRQKINIIRTFQREENGILSYQIGIQFDEPLSEYAAKRKDRFDLTIASLWLLFISVFIILMRAESVLYFKFSKWGYLYSIIAAVFLLSRYFFGALYKPVKIYSSGMYLRLAFSVAINLSADILLVDEILAVGDIQFQNKCLDKIKQLKSGGVTIVLISHSTQQIIDNCNRAIWIDGGIIKSEGDPSKVCEEYLKAMTSQ